jgi:hypothetical protein
MVHESTQRKGKDYQVNDSPSTPERSAASVDWKANQTKAAVIKEIENNLPRPEFQKRSIAYLRWKAAFRQRSIFFNLDRVGRMKLRPSAQFQIVSELQSKMYAHRYA